MTQYESAIHLLAERLNGAEAGLTTSIAEILGTALQELIEAELTGTIQAGPGERPVAGAPLARPKHEIAYPPPVFMAAPSSATAWRAARAVAALATGIGQGGDL